jgi:hypothetical protein
VAHVLGRAEDIGHRRHEGGRQHVGERRQVEAGHVEDAVAQLPHDESLGALVLIAQHDQAMAPAAALLDELAEPGGGLDRRMVG